MKQALSTPQARLPVSPSLSSTFPLYFMTELPLVPGSSSLMAVRLSYFLSLKLGVIVLAGLPPGSGALVSLGSCQVTSSARVSWHRRRLADPRGSPWKLCKLETQDVSWTAGRESRPALCYFWLEVCCPFCRLGRHVAVSGPSIM